MNNTTVAPSIFATESITASLSTAIEEILFFAKVTISMSALALFLATAWV